MSTSRQTFTQVKDILKKLDQSIDAARAKRLQGAPGETNVRAAGSPATGEGHGVIPEGSRPEAAPPVNRATPRQGPPSGPASPFQRRVG